MTIKTVWVIAEKMMKRIWDNAGLLEKLKTFLKGAQSPDKVHVALLRNLH